MKELKVFILGFGNAGKALAKLLLLKEEEIKIEHNIHVKVQGIMTRSKGSVYEPTGLDLNKALKEIEKKGFF